METTVMENSCMYSSELFGLAAAFAFYVGDSTYAAIFAVLSATSVAYHSNKTLTTNLIDKVGIVSLVGYGSYLLYQKCRSGLTTTHQYVCVAVALSTFFLTNYLYLYGYCCDDYCFHADSIVANLYHSLLHLLSVMGHTAILVM